jgi:hypothetical protein
MRRSMRSSVDPTNVVVDARQETREQTISRRSRGHGPASR